MIVSCEHPLDGGRPTTATTSTPLVRPRRYYVIYLLHYRVYNNVQYTISIASIKFVPSPGPRARCNAPALSAAARRTSRVGRRTTTNIVRYIVTRHNIGTIMLLSVVCDVNESKKRKKKKRFITDSRYWCRYNQIPLRTQY